MGKKGSGREQFVLYCCAIFFLFVLIVNANFFSMGVEEESQLYLTSEKQLFLDKSDAFILSNSADFKLSAQNHTFAPFFFSPLAINHCNKELLMSINGIGPGLAGNILETRHRIGFFSIPEDLLQVNGIGPIRLQKFTPYLSFIK